MQGAKSSFDAFLAPGPSPADESGFDVVVVRGGDTQIVVDAKIDVIVGRLAVLIDSDVKITILVGRVVFLPDLAWLLCLFERPRLLRFQQRFRDPTIAAIDTSDRHQLRKISNTGCQFR